MMCIFSWLECTNVFDFGVVKVHRRFRNHTRAVKSVITDASGVLEQELKSCTLPTLQHSLCKHLSMCYTCAIISY